jgi:predicted TIM-barrel fold metal-dependent hydrolase
MTKAGFHVVDADGHVIDTASRLVPFVDEPYRERVIRLIEWKRRNSSGGHLSAAELPFSELAQGYERSGRRLLGTRDVADNLDPEVVAVGEMAKFHPELHEGSGHDPDVTRRDLDGLGIDEAVWFPTSTTSVVAIDEAPFEAALCRAYNRWVGEFCSARPGEFFAVAIMPHWDPELAVAEIERVGQEPWCVGVTSCMTIPGKLPDHPYFDPMYAAVQSHDLALCIHSGTDRPPYAPARGELTDSYFLLHMTGHPWQQMRAMAAMVGGGIYERFPTLRIAHLESGCGWVPYWMERLDDHYETLGYTVPRLKAKPSEHLTGGRCFVSFEADEAVLPAVAAVIGDTQLVYASDYPHYDADWEGLGKIVSRADLTDRQKSQLLGDNARRLFSRMS